MVVSTKAQPQMNFIEEKKEPVAYWKLLYGLVRVKMPSLVTSHTLLLWLSSALWDRIMRKYRGANSMDAGMLMAPTIIGNGCSAPTMLGTPKEQGTSIFGAGPGTRPAQL